MVWVVLGRNGWRYCAEGMAGGGKPLTPELIDFALGVVEEAYDRTEPRTVLMAFQVLQTLL